MSKQKINVKLLRRVKALILEEPLRLEMGDFIVSGDKLAEWREKELRPPCGTAACIAGWTVIELRRDKGERGSKTVTPRFIDSIPAFGVDNEAAEALGLEGVWQKWRLFDVGDWPQPFVRDYRDAVRANDYRKAAQIAARRIEHFIKTKGAE